MRLIDHIPPDLLDVVNVEKTAKIFSELQDVKEIDMQRIHGMLMNNGHASNEIGVKIVEEIFGLLEVLPPAVPKRILRALIQNGERILRFRGTPPMTTLLLQSLSAGLVRNHYSDYYSGGAASTIYPNDFFSARLMNDEDLERHYGGDTIATKYIFSGEEGAGFSGQYHVQIVSPYANDENYRNFVVDMFLLHVKNTDGNSDRFNFYFYNYTFLNPSGMTWMYDLKNSPLREDPALSGFEYPLDSPVS